MQKQTIERDQTAIEQEGLTLYRVSNRKNGKILIRLYPGADTVTEASFDRFTPDPAFQREVTQREIDIEVGKRMELDERRREVQRAHNSEFEQAQKAAMEAATHHEDTASLRNHLEAGGTVTVAEALVYGRMMQSWRMWQDGNSLNGVVPLEVSHADSDKIVCVLTSGASPSETVELYAAGRLSACKRQGFTVGYATGFDYGRDGRESYVVTLNHPTNPRLETRIYLEWDEKYNPDTDTVVLTPSSKITGPSISGHPDEVLQIVNITMKARNIAKSWLFARKPQTIDA